MQDLLGDSKNILSGWKNYIILLLNVHGANSVRQTEWHTAEPTSFLVEILIEKLKRYKSSLDQILAELFHVEYCVLKS
jgi:hypothetical protein